MLDPVEATNTAGDKMVFSRTASEDIRVDIQNAEGHQISMTLTEDQVSRLRKAIAD